MDVLFVSPVLPWPLDAGGRIRTYHLARALARDVRVHMRCVLAPGQHERDAEPLREWCASLELFERSAPGLHRHVLRAKIERWFHSSRLQARLREECASGRFALLHLDELLQARALPDDCAIPLVQHHHKLDVDLFHRTTEGRGPQRHFDLWKLRRLEREAARRTRHHVFCCDEDRVAFERRNGATHAQIVANGFDPEHYARPASRRERARLVFLGSLSYAPNVNGCVRFCSDVLPALVQRHPELVFEIVGREPCAEIRALAGPHVRIHADVADVRPFLERCSVFVVPLRIGGGTRLKISEALALGAPVVSTTIGAEGLSLRDGEHLLLADSPREMQAAISRLLDDPARAAELGARGRECVWRHYTWPILAERLLAFWRSAAART